MTTESVSVRPALAAQERLRVLQGDIMDLILRRNLDVGDPMPTETELCAELGVGRNTIREALKVLQALGVVEIRHGFGTFVATTGFGPLASSLAFRGKLSLRHGGGEALELVDVRQALETGLIGLAMDVMTDEALDGLEECVRAMEDRAAAGVAFTDVDQEFHRRLYEPLHNDLLTSLLDVFWVAYSEIHAEAGVVHGSLIETAQQHRDILDAVRIGDGKRAAKLVAAHFHGIRDHLSAGR